MTVPAQTKQVQIGNYSDRPTEIDYDPPEFVPPTDDEEDEEEEQGTPDEKTEEGPPYYFQFSPQTERKEEEQEHELYSHYNPETANMYAMADIQTPPRSHYPSSKNTPVHSPPRDHQSPNRGYPGNRDPNQLHYFVNRQRRPQRDPRRHSHYNQQNHFEEDAHLPATPSISSMESERYDDHRRNKVNSHRDVGHGSVHYRNNPNVQRNGSHRGHSYHQSYYNGYDHNECEQKVKQSSTWSEHNDTDSMQCKPSYSQIASSVRTHPQDARGTMELPTHRHAGRPAPQFVEQHQSKTNHHIPHKGFKNDCRPYQSSTQRKPPPDTSRADPPRSDPPLFPNHNAPHDVQHVQRLYNPKSPPPQPQNLQDQIPWSDPNQISRHFGQQQEKVTSTQNTTDSKFRNTHHFTSSLNHMANIDTDFWTCLKCTQRNAPTTELCQMCSSPKRQTRQSPPVEVALNFNDPQEQQTFATRPAPPIRPPPKSSLNQKPAIRAHDGTTPSGPPDPVSMLNENAMAQKVRADNQRLGMKCEKKEKQQQSHYGKQPKSDQSRTRPVPLAIETNVTALNVSKSSLQNVSKAHLSKSRQEIPIQLNIDELDPSINEQASVADTGEWGILLKLYNRIQNRKTRIEKAYDKSEDALQRLKDREKEIKQQLKYDRELMKRAFKAMEDDIDDQFAALMAPLKQNQQYLKEQQARFELYEQRVSPSINGKAALSEIGFISLKREVQRKAMEFDERWKRIKSEKVVCKLKYESFLAKRHAEYQDMIQSIGLHNDCNNAPMDVIEQKAEKMIFPEGSLSGVVPVRPKWVEVSMTKTFRDKKASSVLPGGDCDNISASEQEEDSPSSPSSEMSLATHMKYDVTNNLRVLFTFSEKERFHHRNMNILEHEIVFQLQNMKEHKKRIPHSNQSEMSYEWPQKAGMAIYAGTVKVRSRNKNGWSLYKSTVFKYDEFGNQVHDD